MDNKEKDSRLQGHSEEKYDFERVLKALKGTLEMINEPNKQKQDSKHNQNNKSTEK